ncbi:MAG TPA: sulfur carrier protein ThiS [Mycobacteriales bacterium]|jgi:sulfur carrier protein|nr:sulfur carrier protein ThiS [Mycobacteriales bacterium]
MSQVEVNGQARDVDPTTTLGDLIRSLARDVSGCAVAVNGAVVPRGDWERALETGDRIEVLTAVQGG